MGKPAGTISLTNKGQNLITEVKSCYTGTGENNGHNLIYYLELSSAESYAELLEGENDITITYTLIDDI